MPAFCRRATPGGGAGTLTLIDNRTGKRYEVAVSDHGSIKATDLKQVTAGGDGVGLRTYDNGCGLRGSPRPPTCHLCLNVAVLLRCWVASCRLASRPLRPPVPGPRAAT